MTPIPPSKNSTANSATRVAVVGSGPAGLMAATVLSDAGIEVEVFEKRPGLGRKLLIAGSSGLNITHDLPPQEFSQQYHSPTQTDFFPKHLQDFSPEDWIQFIEKRLGLETFKGTSDRYFVREMKASSLLKVWTDDLRKKGVIFHTNSELRDFQSRSNDASITLEFLNSEQREFSGAIFALGGGSWESELPRWTDVLKTRGIGITPWSPSNVGYEVKWPETLLKEALRKPLKNIVLKTSRGVKAGELLITEYGLEGTPIYFLGETGMAYLDLKPAFTEVEIHRKLSETRENLSPIRRVDRLLNLGEAAFALVFHLAPAEVRTDLKKLAGWIKCVPLKLERARPLEEAISSRGGVRMDELTSELRSKKFPRLWFAGEMLDWDAPTGGFLIQGSVLQGVVAARDLISSLCDRTRIPSSE